MKRYDGLTLAHIANLDDDQLALIYFAPDQPEKSQEESAEEWSRPLTKEHFAAVWQQHGKTAVEIEAMWKEDYERST